MHGFVSHYSMKLDAKGRVSVPAPFRSILSRDGFEGLYCFPSPHMPAVDAGGNALIAEIERRLEGVRPLTADHDFLATALFGISEILKVDADGRVSLTESIKSHAGIGSEVVFVGQGYKFQIWEPQRFAAHRAEAMRRALSVLDGGTSAPVSGGVA
ncbi:division/cell wall cluster transcriptional repressor MraZ [Segnochrobactraceae bacterium EtOH-i3]